MARKRKTLSENMIINNYNYLLTSWRKVFSGRKHGKHKFR